jgi:hypothetical protein
MASLTSFATSASSSHTSPTGSISPSAAMALASATPLIPPADVPDTMSTTKRRRTGALGSGSDSSSGSICASVR